MYTAVTAAAAVRQQERCSIAVDAVADVLKGNNYDTKRFAGNILDHSFSCTHTTHSTIPIPKPKQKHVTTHAGFR
ncbi:hypothetical protein E2C01_097422 [Portunus trituberculatus]|uniref:Uncharacterized protein n=1 Tax=Portunus trituberculatus TaxID=210409 RepID=A0A5B7K5N8_PORTR|nr:hypothetical protein [Portunus trituberculatus]